MKKTYSQPEWKIMILNMEDAITTSGEGDGTLTHDPDGLLSGKADNWEW